MSHVAQITIPAGQNAALKANLDRLIATNEAKGANRLAGPQQAPVAAAIHDAGDTEGAINFATLDIKSQSNPEGTVTTYTITYNLVGQRDMEAERAHTQGGTTVQAPRQGEGQDD